MVLNPGSSSTIHLDRASDHAQRAKIADAVRAQKGVVGVAIRDDKPHLTIINYDPDEVNSKALLQVVMDNNGRAELIGL